MSQKGSNVNIRWHLLRMLVLICLMILIGCAPAAPPTPTPPPTLPSTPIVVRNWADNISQSILDQFTAETGIPVTYMAYDTQEEAIEQMRAGEVYDVVVLDNQLIPQVVRDGLVAELNYSNIPNFRNISANFRDLAYDPENRHAIPYSWGATGMVFRPDLVEAPLTKWADLWNESYQGKVLGWTLPRYMIGVTLKSLGYSLNSEDPEELEAALERLLEIKPHIQMVDWEPSVAAPGLISGEVVAGVGQVDDVTASSAENVEVAFILPEEGGILWGDNFTVPANSPNKASAEAFINFLLRPEISAQIINETLYWLPNDPALEFVEPEIRSNTAIFPTAEMLQNAEVLLPLSPEGEALYADIWERFLAAEG